MSDYKDKYLRAVKALDEAEREGNDNVQDLYRVFISIISEMKGRHREIDKAIQAMPSRLKDNSSPPIEELAHLKDLVVSYFNKDDAVVEASVIMDALLSALMRSDVLQEGVGALQNDLKIAKTSADFEINQLVRLRLRT